MLTFCLIWMLLVPLKWFDFDLAKGMPQEQAVLCELDIFGGWTKYIRTNGQHQKHQKIRMIQTESNTVVYYNLPTKQLHFSILRHFLQWLRLSQPHPGSLAEAQEKNQQNQMPTVRALLEKASGALSLIPCSSGSTSLTMNRNDLGVKTWWATSSRIPYLVPKFLLFLRMPSEAPFIDRSLTSKCKPPCAGVGGSRNSKWFHEMPDNVHTKSCSASGSLQNKS